MISSEQIESAASVIADQLRIKIKVVERELLAKYNENHDENGRFGSGGGSAVSRAYDAQLLATRETLARDKPVVDAWHASQKAEIGQRILQARVSTPTTALDQKWESIKLSAYQATRASWGGQTIDSHTGETISPKSGYAVAANDRGQGTISIHENASGEEFSHAMDSAKAQFGSVLERSGYNLGVFHDDGKGTIDIDPSVIVQTTQEADAIHAYNGASQNGGAYDFSTGNAYWPKSADLVKYAPENFSAEWNADPGDDNGPCPGCQDAQDNGPYDNPYDVPDPNEVCFAMNGVGKGQSECNCTITVNDSEDEIDALDFDPSSYDIDKYVMADLIKLRLPTMAQRVAAYLNKGGSGSGNYGHSGRAGEVGGSGAGGTDRMTSAQRRTAKENASQRGVSPRIAERQTGFAPKPAKNGDKLGPKARVEVTDGHGGTRFYEMKPSANIHNVNAWISPKGEFYPVYVDEHGKPSMEMDHTTVAEYLGDKTGGTLLDQAGWIHMSDSIGVQFNQDRVPTDAQAKVMGRFFDEWSQIKQNALGTNADKKDYYENWMNIEGNMKAASLTKGGSGSGNFGHEGRTGEVGGSGAGGARISTIQEAIEKLGNGQGVEFEQPRDAVTLLHELSRMGREAQAAGQKAKTYDLCKVSVSGTNLFCNHNMGISRDKMPQLSGKPLPGSPADSMPKNQYGQVDLGPAFRDYLESQGHTVTSTTDYADRLRASQREMNGVKVGGILDSIDNKTYTKAPIFVSRENYVIDGHHRYAAVVASEWENTGTRMQMPILRVDMPVLDVLQAANDFASSMGIPQAGVSKTVLAELLKGGSGSGNWGHAGRVGEVGGSGIGGGDRSFDLKGAPNEKQFANAEKTASAKGITFRKGLGADGKPIPTEGHISAEMQHNLQSHAMMDPVRQERAVKIYQDYHNIAVSQMPNVPPQVACSMVAVSSQNTMMGPTTSGASPTIDIATNTYNALEANSSYTVTPEMASTLATDGHLAFPSMDANGHDSETPMEAGTYKLSELAPTTAARFIGAGLCDPVSQSVRMYRGESPNQVITSPKLRNFASNIYLPGDTRSVTVDRWAARSALIGPGTSFKVEEMNVAQGIKGMDEAETWRGSSGNAPYSILAENIDYFSSHNALNADGSSRDVLPLQAQAITWPGSNAYQYDFTKYNKAAVSDLMKSAMFPLAPFDNPGPDEVSEERAASDAAIAARFGLALSIPTAVQITQPDISSRHASDALPHLQKSDQNPNKRGRSITNAIARLRPLNRERAIVVNNVGKVVWEKDGGHDFVPLGELEHANLEGATFIHNHPSGVAPSGNDIASACALRFGCVYAVGKTGYTYCVEPPDGHDTFEPDMWPNIDKVGKAADAAVRVAYTEMLQHGEVSADEANIEHWNIVDEAIAEATGIKYTRTGKGVYNFSKLQIPVYNDKGVSPGYQSPQQISDEANTTFLDLSKGQHHITKGGSGSGNYGHAGRAGEVGGSGEGGALKAIVDKQEKNWLAARRPTESLAIYDKDGKLLIYRLGTESKVSISIQEANKIAGSTATHWHPDFVDPKTGVRHDGGDLSVQDMLTGALNWQDEMRSVSADRTSSLKYHGMFIKQEDYRTVGLMKDFRAEERAISFRGRQGLDTPAESDAKFLALHERVVQSFPKWEYKVTPNG